MNKKTKENEMQLDESTQLILMQPSMHGDLQLVQEIDDQQIAIAFFDSLAKKLIQPVTTLSQNRGWVIVLTKKHAKELIDELEKVI